MANNDLTSKAEAAMKSVVDALALTGVTSNTNQEDAVLELPSVIVSAQQGEENPIGSGNFVLTYRITVNSKTNVDDALTTHRTRVATVFDAFMADNIGATLSAAVTDFYAYVPWARRSGKEIREDSLSDWLELDILSAASDL